MPIYFTPEQVEARIREHQTFIDFFRYQSKKFAHCHLAHYYRSGKYQTLTYANVDQLSTLLACQMIGWVQEGEVIAFLGTSGLDYMLWLLALLKLRHPFLLISPRNSEAANASLIHTTRATLWVVMASCETQARSAAQENARIQVVHPLDLPALLRQPPRQETLPLPRSEDPTQDTVILLHSSGTTRFPHPIQCTNQYLFYLPTFYESTKAQNNNPDVFNHQDVILACAPLFHAFGVTCLSNGITAGASLVFMETATPSQQDIHRALTENQATILLMPPILLEGMIPFLKETQDLRALQRLKWLVVGSAPLKEKVGGWFRQRGVNVINAFGGTEMGKIMAADLDRGDNWYALRPLMADVDGVPFCTFEQVQPGVFHLYMRSGYPHLAKGVANRPDGGYNTNDLYTPDTVHPGCWHFYGRIDDILVLENGEKTNPVPIEATLRQSPFIKQAVVLGHRRQCTAALVEIDLTYAIHHDPVTIVQGVKEAVETANKDSDSFGSLMPQMIKILPLNQTLPSTDKGTLKRKQILLDYQDAIETLYQQLLDPKGQPGSDTVEQAVTQVMQLPFLPASTSLFELGMNSLKAIQLSNLLQNSFGPLPAHFVYNHPSLNELKLALARPGSSHQNHTQILMNSYLERAKSEFLPVTGPGRACRKVLLTGATGSLGAFVLQALLRDRRVEKVYCMVRGEAPERRLKQALVSRELDPDILKSERVEIVQMTLDAPLLGLSLEEYRRLKEEVDVVQHCGWLLDFNLGLEHYDKACIAPFYNLVRFAYCQDRPIHLHFVSSVSAGANLGESVPEEPLPADPQAPMPMGYAQSKFICEVLLDYLVKHKGMPCTVQRLGQVCGDTLHGVWNPSEQFPMMLVGGAQMRKMPRLTLDLDWIPVDSAAAAIVDLILGSHSTRPVYHIVHPYRQTWARLLDSLKACGLQFETVSPKEWLQSLAKQETNPAYRLLSYFEQTFESDMKLPLWETVHTAQATHALHRAPVLDTHLLSLYLKHWKRIGFYTV